ECRVVVVCDGCEGGEGEGQGEGEGEGEEGQDRTSQETSRRPNYKHGPPSRESAERYRAHLRRLRTLVAKRTPPFDSRGNGSVELPELPRRHGSAKAIEAAFDLIPHDNFFVRDVDYLPRMLRFLERGETESWLSCVHFPSTATLHYVEKAKRRYGIDLSGLRVRSRGDALRGTFVPLVFWYGRTHVARTSHFRDVILRDHPLKVGDHLEEVWGTRQLQDIAELAKGSETSDDEGGFETRFRGVHAKYGNYVFFDGDDGDGEDQEVLYHVSGRKARAALATSDRASGDPSTVGGSEPRRNSAFDPREKSFTTARRAVAVVPGLDFGPPAGGDGDGDGNRRGGSKKFRQRCFHCGEKGHSFKFCPDVAGDRGVVPTEVLDLS
ncbi:hypothetical protein ACHAWF_011652, partial [Thalassiosira exigua]